MLMIRKLFSLLLFSLFFLSAGKNGLAQSSLIWQDPAKDYKIALDLLEKKQYGSALEKFRKVKNSEHFRSSLLRADATYFEAFAALELLHDNAPELMQQFIAVYPESPRINQAFFDLARFKYKKRRYGEAAEWFARIDSRELQGEELGEYYFKSGYSAFMEEDFVLASKMFHEIKDHETSYSSAARYYYGHIAYVSGNNETALQSFQSLSNDEVFGPLVPYYIAQIYFLQKKYREVTEFAPGLLENAEPKRAPELSRLIGESYYNLLKYEEAVPYLERYVKERNPSASDLYQLGYALSRSDRCAEASEFFKRVISDDTLSQAAWYNLGECYLKMGEKNYARSAFQAAAGIDADPVLQESASYQFAILAYELSNHPYTDAVRAINDFLLKFPNSANGDKVRGLLVNAFMTTRNYKEALASLDRIREKSAPLEKIYQQVAYNYGVQLFNAGNYPASIDHFNKAIATGNDHRMAAEATYWKADALYRQRKYSESAALFEQFLESVGAPAFTHYFDAHYNLGYAYFKLRKYPEAITWFRKYASIAPPPSAKRKSDAILRTADAFFITGDYYAAADFYGQATSGQIQQDYALFQQALSYGLVGMNNEKISALTRLQSAYPSSTYSNAALFETGKTLHAEGREDDALAMYEKVITKTDGQLAAKALSQQALIYYNQGLDDKALTISRQLVNDFPQTPEAMGALNLMENIYVNSGRGVEYAQYVSGVSWAGKSASALDSVAYESAEKLYMTGDCSNAISSFGKYLSSYEGGKFELKARYYRGECLFKGGDYENALKDLLIVLQSGSNEFTERALVRTANVYYFRNQFAESIPYYEQLDSIATQPQNVQEARVGLMRSYFQSGDTLRAGEYGAIVLRMDKLSQSLSEEAQLISALKLIKENQKDAAKSALNTLANSSSSSFGAQAAYHEAFINYQQGALDSAEALVFRMTEKFPGYEYWLAKSFILLADVYVAKGDFFQAKATLQSIIDNYSGDDLKDISKARLKTVLELEQATGSAEESNTPVMEIELNQPGENP